MADQLECRIVVRYAWDRRAFRLGMWCPNTRRIEWLGTHPIHAVDAVVRGLRNAIEQHRHLVTYSVQTDR